MKTSSLLSILAAVLPTGPAVAQNASPPATPVQPTVRPTNVVEDGLVFYRGQTFLIRNGRAAAVDSTLLPEGEILTPQGRRVPMPRDVGINPKPTVEDGLFMVNGDTYLLRNGSVTRVDASLVPEGRVLTDDNRLLPLPSDFSGFVLDRAPDGSVLPTPPALAGPQSLPGQAGLKRTPTPVQPAASSQAGAGTSGRVGQGASTVDGRVSNYIRDGASPNVTNGGTVSAGIGVNPVTTNNADGTVTRQAMGANGAITTQVLNPNGTVASTAIALPGTDAHANLQNQAQAGTNSNGTNANTGVGTTGNASVNNTNANARTGAAVNGRMSNTDANGTATNANGTTNNTNGNSTNANGTPNNANGNTTNANGTSNNANGNTTNANGTSNNTNGNTTNANGTVNGANGTTNANAAATSSTRTNNPNATSTTVNRNSSSTGTNGAPPTATTAGGRISNNGTARSGTTGTSGGGTRSTGTSGGPSGGGTSGGTSGGGTSGGSSGGGSSGGGGSGGAGGGGGAGGS